MLEKYLHIHPEVQRTISSREPVVAISSDIIVKDTNYNSNIKIANDICKIIRNCGAVPATTAIINGILKVGLTEEEIEFLSLDKNITTITKKDIPFAISKKQTHSTTISSSIVLSNLAGIKVLVTSSIGKINIYSDLHELGKSNIALICSGINSTLDKKSTLEYLNTKEIPIIGYKTDKLPIFSDIENHIEVDYKIDSPLEISKLLKSKLDLELDGGMIISNKIKKEINTNNSDIDIKLLHNNVKLASDISKNLSKLYKLRI